MNAPGNPMHPTDDELVLHYYGEDEVIEREATRAHLASCESCRNAYRGLADVLALVTTHADEPAPAGFERVMWARVRPTIETPDRAGWRSWFSIRRLALAGGAAALVIAAFVAGRWSGPSGETAPTAPVVAAVAPDRVWLVAVGDHLDRSQMVLAEVLNAPPADPMPAGERERAADLVAASRLIRQSAGNDQDSAVTEVLEELERVLIEIANGEDWSQEDLEALRRRIESRGVLFRLRVVGAEVRERERIRPPES